MLGKRQVEALERYTKSVREPYNILIKIGGHVRFTREGGGGEGHVITVGYRYISDGYNTASNMSEESRGIKPIDLV